MKRFGGMLFLCGGAALAQPAEQAPVSYPTLPQETASADGFLTPGWMIAARAEGDLNLDGRKDVVLALWTQKASRASSFEDRQSLPPYRLIIGFAESKGGYRLVADNKGLLVPPGYSGAFEDGLDADTFRIANGRLDISRELLRGHYRYRFRWSDGAFRLIGYEYVGSDGRCITTTSINFLTKKAHIEVEALVEDGHAKKVTRRTKSAPLRALGQMDSDADWYPEESILGSWPTC